MTSNNDPMNLENLPQYLKSQKENGDTGSAPVVGMGQIVVPKQKSKWPNRIIFMAVMFTIGVGGMFAYDAMTPQQSSAIVERSRIDTIPTVSENGGEIVTVKEADEKPKKKSFLDWLFGK